MLWLNPDDPLELTWVKLRVSNILYYLCTQEGHRAELDALIRACWHDWDRIAGEEGRQVL